MAAKAIAATKPIRFTPDTVTGDEWGQAGLLGLSLALKGEGVSPSAIETTIDRIQEAQTDALSLRDGRIFLPAWEGLDFAIRDRMNSALMQSLLGVSQQRKWDNQSKELLGYVHQKWPKIIGTKSGDRTPRVELTRAILPNWQNEGSTGGNFSLVQAIPLWFAPCASLALTTPGGGVALIAPSAPHDLTLAPAIARAILPTDIEECYPSGPLDCALEAMCRLRRAGVATAGLHFAIYEYAWVAVNKHFRQIRAIYRQPAVSDDLLDRWQEFAGNLPVLRNHSTGALFNPPIREFAAGNLLRGLPAHHGYGTEFDRECKDWRGARAILDLLMGNSSLVTLNDGDGLLGERLKSLREGRGWSQKDLATAAHVAQSVVADLESGVTTNPRQMTLTKLARALGEEEL